MSKCTTLWHASKPSTCSKYSQHARGIKGSDLPFVKLITAVPFALCVANDSETCVKNTEVMLLNFLYQIVQFYLAQSRVHA